MSAEYLSLCKSAAERNEREGRPVTALLWRNEAHRNENGGAPDVPRRDRKEMPLVPVTEEYTKEN